MFEDSTINFILTWKFVFEISTTNIEWPALKTTISEDFVVIYYGLKIVWIHNNMHDVFSVNFPNYNLTHIVYQ
jgi:hypothetical protein